MHNNTNNNNNIKQWQLQLQLQQNHNNRNITEAGGWFGARDMLSELEDEKEAPMMNFSL